MFGVLVLAAGVGVALGLLASALARTSEVAIALLPVILLPMVLLGGALFPKHEMTLPVLSEIMPTRWAYEGALLLEAARRPRWSAPPVAVPPGGGAVSAPAPYPMPGAGEDMAESHFLQTDRGSVVQSMLVLSGMLVTCVIGILGILKRRDVH
jgi:hypothetical protein